MSYFIFKGIDSREFGIVSAMSLPPVAERKLTEKEIPGRPVPLNRLEVMRKNVQITITMTVTDMSRLAEINAWLQGRGDLILSSDTTKKYIAYVSMGISPERVLKLCGSFPVTFTAEPFRYAVDNTPTKFGSSGNDVSTYITFVSGTAECEPLFCFTFAGKIAVTIDDGESFEIESSGNPTIINNTRVYKYYREEIFVDSGLKIAYKIAGGAYEVVTNRTWGKFPTLKSGRNEIKITLKRDSKLFDGKSYEPGNVSYEGLVLTQNERWY